MDALINGEHISLMWGVMLGLVAIAMWAEETKWGKRASGTIIVILLGLILANIGVLPSSSPVYDHVWSSFVPLAIPLLLVKADLNKIIKESGPTLIAFLFGALGSILGALIAFVLIPLPELKAELTAILTASYIGGSMNFAAVSNALNVAGEDIMVPSLAADHLVAILYLVVLAWIPASLFFQKLYGHTHDGSQEAEVATNSLWGEFRIKHVVSAVAVSYFIVLVSKELASHINIQGAEIMSITAISVLIASLFGKELAKLKGVFQLGMMIMYLFFATIGTGANLWVLFETAPVLIIFIITIIIGHFVVIFAAGKFFKLNLPEIITASNACALGPTTAAGLAASKGWSQLITPGILVGILGYAIANFIGIALWNLLS